MVVLGGGGVGKSALTIQFTQNLFVTEYDPTIENSYRKQVALDDSYVMLDILDTAGQEEYSVMRGQYIRTGAGFILVYSVASKTSFQTVSELRKQILMIKERPDYPIILLGNKADLEEQDRRVTYQQGQELASSWECGYFETSAKTRLNVEESFDWLVRAMVKHAHKIKSGDSGGGLGASGKDKTRSSEIRKDTKKDKKSPRPEKMKRSVSDAHHPTAIRRKKHRCVVM